jgi:Cu/Ag efflux protein CusF
MKNIKITIILILGIISLNAKAQNTYQQTMSSGMQEWSKGNNIKAIAIFERVSQVEKRNGYLPIMLPW